MAYLDDPRVIEMERNGFIEKPVYYDREVVAHCADCEYEILEGDEYMEDQYDGLSICMECFKERFRWRCG